MAQINQMDVLCLPDRLLTKTLNLFSLPLSVSEFQSKVTKPLINRDIDVLLLRQGQRKNNFSNSFYIKSLFSSGLKISSPLNNLEP